MEENQLQAQWIRTKGDNVEKENIVDKENKQFEQVKAELELVKKQRDIALGKLNKTLNCITELRKIIEDAQKR